MAYDNLELHCALISGKIYLTKINKNGMMSDSGRDMTEETLRAATEWFVANDKYMTSWQSGHHLFYTKDPKKAEQIKKILEI